MTAIGHLSQACVWLREYGRFEFFNVGSDCDGYWICELEHRGGHPGSNKNQSCSKKWFSFTAITNEYHKIVETRTVWG
jgi:hypothetical protein